MPSTDKEAEISDPLSEVTRNERRSLLLVSLIAATVAGTGLVPTKIEALGVEFGPASQRTLLGLLALVVLYFVLAFSLYASADFLAWRLSILRAWRDAFDEGAKANRPPPDLASPTAIALSEIVGKYRKFFVLVRPVAIARAVFEFGVPILAGLAAVFMVLYAALNH